MISKMQSIANKLYNLFYRVNMSWKTVIILSLACGVIPGVLMIPEFLIGTSLQQPGISYEFWVFMALLISLNCEKPLEAGLKTFVFFLITQPLIYLVQVPFSWQGWELFGYYPRWAILTLFTLPGGMLAWYTKKGNWIGVLLFSVANFFVAGALPYMFIMMIDNFPKMLLCVLFMVCEIVFFIGLLFKGKKEKLLAYAIALVLIVASCVQNFATTVQPQEYTITLEGKAPFTLVDEITDPEINIDGNRLVVKFDYVCGLPVRVVDADGNTTALYLSYDQNGFEYKYEE